MGLNDEIGNPFLGGVWQFNVARGGCGEYGMVARDGAHLLHDGHSRSRLILGQFPFMLLTY